MHISLLFYLWIIVVHSCYATLQQSLFSDDS